jgi:4-amino-4-deoxy-L-arabinose transferase-like glycosyltransferase
VSIGYYVPKYGLIYDGGLYASLGYSLQNDGSYVFNAAPGDVPPVYPFLLAISIFLLGEKGIFIVTPLFSIFFVLIVFLIFKRDFREEIAFLGALLILFTPPIFFYSIQVVRDLPLIFFLLVSYLLYLNLERYRPTLIEAALGVSMALAFLTKYAAIIYLLPIFFHSRFTRKSLKLSVGVSLTLLLPWMAWSYSNHGTPLVSHSTYLTKDIGENAGRFVSFLLPLLIKWSFTPIFILSLVGFAETIRKNWRDLFSMLLVLTIFVGVIWPEKDIRYVLFTYILIVYFAIIFLEKFTEKKNYIMVFLLVAILFQGQASYKMAEANVYQNFLFEDAGFWLRENSPENARILTHSYRQVNYFSHRRTFQPPPDVEKVERFIEHYNTSYVVVDTYEKYTPSYMYTYFDRYTLVKTFQRDKNEIKIFKLQT